MGTDITIRHDDVKNTLYLSAHHAGGLARKEPSRLSANGDNTRPDLQMVLNGQQYLIDVTIRHPLSQKYLLKSSRNQLHAAMVGEQEKIVKYSSMAAAQKAKFKPFSVETYGGLGKSARGIYRLIQASARDHMMMWPYQQVVEEMRGAVAIAIQRGNAMVMLAAYNRAISRPARSHNMMT
jgi:hypothetical protein